MADELDPNKKDDGTPVVVPAESGAPIKPSDEEVKKLQLQKDLSELEAAKVAANTELQRIRNDKREAKKQPKPAPTPEAEEEKVIDENDPDAKAWLKKINSTISPVAEELEKEKAEIRSFAIAKFLEDKPSLAKNPEKLKELIGFYERSHTASERTVEGVTVDLDRAYAAVYHKELLDAARQGRLDNARKDAIFSDIAVSRGSTGYTAPQETTKIYSDDEKAILARWEQSAAFPKIEEKTSQG
jgi:hypothetical protein